MGKEEILSVEETWLGSPKTIKLPANIHTQIEKWFDVEWGITNLATARKLAEMVFRQYEWTGRKDCVMLMMIFDPSEPNEEGWHFSSLAGCPE